jgi:hypothetical protein
LEKGAAVTFWKFFTSRYTAHLEQENRDLKSLLAQERQEVRRLTEAAIPALQRRVAIDTTNAAKDFPRPHKIVKATDDKSAFCHCGWEAQSDDPVELQSAISAHYKEHFVPLKVRPRSTREQIQALEAESQNQRTPQA